MTRWVIIFVLLFLTATALQGQDSVATRIAKVKTIGDTTYYTVFLNWMAKKEKVIIVCCCRDKRIRQKGEIILVARKDLIFD